MDSLYYEKTTPFIIAVVGMMGLCILLEYLIKKKETLRLLYISIFLVYLLGNLYYTILSRQITNTHVFDFDVLASIKRTFSLSDGRIEILQRDAIVELTLNLVLYIPFGFLLSCIRELKKSNVLIIGICLSTLTEIVQFALGLGLGEVADIINNGIGVAVGVLCACFLMKLKIINT